MTDQNEFDFMRKAVEVARKCVAEDQRISPKVGAVVVKNGILLATAFRGEIEAGQHAEFTALEKKLKHESLAGCTLYTTLEPCTDRNSPKLSCSERLKDRKVARVVIGMLDPNQAIRGRGILSLRKAGIDVSFFPTELMAELEELNREFIRDQEAKTDKGNPLAGRQSGDPHSYQNELSEARHQLEQLAQENVQLKAALQELKTAVDEDLRIEDAIIALCTPNADKSLQELMVALQAHDKQTTNLIQSAIGRLKSRGILYNASQLYPDSLRLRIG
jgi:pyrimidine deaminase RibD-like protein